MKSKSEIKIEIEKIMQILFELEEYELCEELMLVYKNNWSLEQVDLPVKHLNLIKKDE